VLSKMKGRQYNAGRIPGQKETSMENLATSRTNDVCNLI